ncbi:MAG: hypothetical protein HPY83_15160 [Anaerolineae bacterium]|nr:hypothetical protein [Anaerolineae bacterium]
MAVRRAARTLGLRPVGSLGVVVRAYKTGVLSLPEADVILDDLCSRSSLYVTRAIVEMAVEELRRRLDE